MIGVYTFKPRVFWSNFLLAVSFCSQNFRVVGRWNPRTAIFLLLFAPSASAQIFWAGCFPANGDVPELKEAHLKTIRAQAGRKGDLPEPWRLQFLEFANSTRQAIMRFLKTLIRLIKDILT